LAYDDVLLARRIYGNFLCDGVIYYYNAYDLCNDPEYLSLAWQSLGTKAKNVERKVLYQIINATDIQRGALRIRFRLLEYLTEPLKVTVTCN
jgi:hypothetical protein